ncbi:MAG: TolC family protein, partial [Bryobacterales bacterium]|nr:TolC family protein [Bryobacterales bacterium]
MWRHEWFVGGSGRAGQSIRIVGADDIVDQSGASHPGTSDWRCWSVKGCGIVLGCVRLWARVFLALAVPMSGVADADTPIVFDLTLKDAIERALERSRSLLDHRSDREVQRLALEVAEDRWRPRLTVAPFASSDRQDRKAGVGTETSLRIPTGGEFTLRWEKALSEEFDDRGTQTLRFSQPLLEGAWAGIDSAAVRQARIEEEINVLALREAVADLVVEVVGSYRSLIGAARQVEIGETSLRRAHEQLEATRALIRAGSVAQREAAVANRELSLARARNRMDAANSALIAILDLGSTVRVRALDGLQAAPGQGEQAPGLDEVLRSRADFHQARLRVDVARIGLAVARNKLLPDLSVGLELSRDDAHPGPRSVRRSHAGRLARRRVEVHGLPGERVLHARRVRCRHAPRDAVQRLLRHRAPEPRQPRRRHRVVVGRGARSSSPRPPGSSRPLQRRCTS